MATTDPIADMLTRIRNANSTSKDFVDIPSSKIKLEIVKILKYEGFIKHYKLFRDHKQGTIRLYLKYGSNKERVINGLERVSKPGLRQYLGQKEIPKVLGGMGITVISSSRGIFTGKQCKKLNVGGEILCKIW